YCIWFNIWWALWGIQDFRNSKWFGHQRGQVGILPVFPFLGRKACFEKFCKCLFAQGMGHIRDI
ncbi:uncharacterized protein METZ01_LOCUS269984, partial [marine metagenome]